MKFNLKKAAMLLTLTVVVILLMFAGCSYDEGDESRPEVSVTLPGIITVTGEITINKIGAWFESAYLEWAPTTDAVGYNVYYKGGTITDWTKIDNELIREYNDSVWRADILGLVGGVTYNLAVLPIYSDGESDVAKEQASGGQVTPIAHVREGYAFEGAEVPGAYKNDGSLKDNAVVIYVSENNKNRIALEITGAKKNPCVGLQEIIDGFSEGQDTRPLSIRLIGNVTDFNSLKDNAGDLVIGGIYNNSLTFEGIGNDAVANGWGIKVKFSSYVEIRNIGIMNCDSYEGDNINLEQSNDHIWVHNCDFFYGEKGRDADQVKGDGALDTKKSMYVTQSYNHFWDCGKTMLVGNHEEVTEQNYLTFHHNWFDHSDSRQPRVRKASAHVYNNYYDGVAEYGAGATLGSSIFMESNYFCNSQFPILISMQGSDLYELGKVRKKSNSTFSHEAGGMIKAYDNYMEGAYTFIPYGATEIVTNGILTSASERRIDTQIDFDAYVVANRKDKVPNTLKNDSVNDIYNNFDLSLYKYKPTAVKDVPTEVTKFAGRVDGGDFRWKFTADDDTSCRVNKALKKALRAYKSGLKKISGIDE